MNIALLLEALKIDEGWRPHLYDDATAKDIVPGSHVIGHPTAGYGFALDVSPLTLDEGEYILRGRAAQKYSELLARAPWVADMPEPVQRALGNLVYNLGVSGLLTFSVFLELLQQRKFAEAAEDLFMTKYAKQVGGRATRIAALISECAIAPNEI